MKNQYQSSFISFVLLALSTLMVPELASAEIFKCVNTKGEIYYNDKSCLKNNEETKMKGVKDPKNGFVPSTEFIHLENDTKKYTTSGAKGNSATSGVSGRPQDAVKNSELLPSGTGGKTGVMGSGASKKTDSMDSITGHQNNHSNGANVNNISNAETNMKLVNDVQRFEPEVPMK